MKVCVECSRSYALERDPFQIDEWLCRECQKNPAVQVRVLLVRARLQGLEFDRAWQYALGTPPSGRPNSRQGLVRWPHDTNHRQEWKGVFEDRGTVASWEAAYCRLASPEEESFELLMAAA